METPKEVIKEAGVPVPETERVWELVNPEGVVMVKPVKLAPRPATLEGKTVVLLWNGKAGGDFFQDRLTELLAERVKDIKLIKVYDHGTNELFQHPPQPDQLGRVVDLKPAMVISAQGD